MNNKQVHQISISFLVISNDNFSKDYLKENFKNFTERIEDELLDEYFLDDSEDKYYYTEPSYDFSEVINHGLD